MRGFHFGQGSPSPQLFPDGEREPRGTLDLASESIKKLEPADETVDSARAFGRNGLPA